MTSIRLCPRLSYLHFGAIPFAVFCLTISCVTAVYGQTDQLNEMRTWRDVRGNELEARFMRFREPTVYLRKNSRQTVKIHPSKLSKPDQDYIIGLLRKQKKNELAATFSELATAGPQTGNRPSSEGDAPTPPGKNPPKPGNKSGQIPSRSTFLSPKGETPMLSDVQIPGNETEEAYKPKTGDNPNSNSNLPNGSRVRNPNVDPFADLKPSEPKTSAPMTSSPTSNFEQTERAREPIGDQSNGYRPPVLANKFDDTRDIPAEASEGQTTSGWSKQSMLLVALGVIALLLLIMVSLLVMVLVKAKRPQPRRSYF